MSKNRGKKATETIFPDTHEKCEQKMLGKISSQKVRKHVFCIHTKIVTKKWGGKNARNNFSRNTPIVRAKNVGKKSSQKSAKTRFIYSHEYHDQKLWGKNVQNNFS